MLQALDPGLRQPVVQTGDDTTWFRSAAAVLLRKVKDRHLNEQTQKDKIRQRVIGSGGWEIESKE